MAFWIYHLLLRKITDILLWWWMVDTSVGTSTGAIGLWEVSSGKKLLSKYFNVWEIEACSTLFKVHSLLSYYFFLRTKIQGLWNLNNLQHVQTSLVRDSCMSVNRVTWSPEGSLFGMFKTRGTPGNIRLQYWNFLCLQIHFIYSLWTGVAYSKHLVQTYSFHGGINIKEQLEVYLIIYYC